MTRRMTRVFGASVIALAAATANAWAQDPRAADANGKMLKLSDIQRLASDAEVTSNGVTRTPAKRFLVPFRGLLRVQWKVRSTVGGQSANVFIQSVVDLCGGATNQNTSSASYVTGQCSLRVAAGDIVEVSVSANGGADGQLKDVRLFYDVIPANAVGKVLP